MNRQGSRFSDKSLGGVSMLVDPSAKWDMAPDEEYLMDMYSRRSASIAPTGDPENFHATPRSDLASSLASGRASIGDNKLTTAEYTTVDTPNKNGGSGIIRDTGTGRANQSSSSGNYYFNGDASTLSGRGKGDKGSNGRMSNGDAIGNGHTNAHDDKTPGARVTMPSAAVTKGKYTKSSSSQGTSSKFGFFSGRKRLDGVGKKSPKSYDFNSSAGASELPTAASDMSVQSDVIIHNDVILKAPSEFGDSSPEATNVKARHAGGIANGSQYLNGSTTAAAPAVDRSSETPAAKFATSGVGDIAIKSSKQNQTPAKTSIKRNVAPPPPPSAISARASMNVQTLTATATTTTATAPNAAPEATATAATSVTSATTLTTRTNTKATAPKTQEILPTVTSAPVSVQVTTATTAGAVATIKTTSTSPTSSPGITSAAKKATKKAAPSVPISGFVDSRINADSVQPSQTATNHALATSRTSSPDDRKESQSADQITSSIFVPSAGITKVSPRSGEYTFRSDNSDFSGTLSPVDGDPPPSFLSSSYRKSLQTQLVSVLGLQGKGNQATSAGSSAANGGGVGPRTRTRLPGLFLSRAAEEEGRVGGSMNSLDDVVIPTSNPVVRDKHFKTRLEMLMSARSNSPSVQSLNSSPLLSRGPNAEKNFVNNMSPSSSSAMIQSNNNAADGKSISDSLDSVASTETGNTKNAKKYRFLIEGIDTPAVDAASATVGNALAPGRLSGLVPDEGGEGARADEVGSPEAEMTRRNERKGFSYLLDRKLAAEVTRRAVEMTSRRPHEVVALQKDRQAAAETLLKDARTRRLLSIDEAGLKEGEGLEIGDKDEEDVEEGEEEGRSELLRQIRDHLKKRQANGVLKKHFDQADNISAMSGTENSNKGSKLYQQQQNINQNNTQQPLTATTTTTTTAATATTSTAADRQMRERLKNTTDGPRDEYIMTSLTPQSITSPMTPENDFNFATDRGEYSTVINVFEPISRRPEYETTDYEIGRDIDREQVAKKQQHTGNNNNRGLGDLYTEHVTNPEGLLQNTTAASINIRSIRPTAVHVDYHAMPSADVASERDSNNIYSPVQTGMIFEAVAAGSDIHSTRLLITDQQTAGKQSASTEVARGAAAASSSNANNFAGIPAVHSRSVAPPAAASSKTNTNSHTAAAITTASNTNNTFLYNSYRDVLAERTHLNEDLYKDGGRFQNGAGVSVKNDQTDENSSGYNVIEGNGNGRETRTNGNGLHSDGYSSSQDDDLNNSLSSESIGDITGVLHRRLQQRSHVIRRSKYSERGGTAQVGISDSRHLQPSQYRGRLEYSGTRSSSQPRDFNVGNGISTAGHQAVTVEISSSGGDFSDSAGAAALTVGLRQQVRIPRYYHKHNANNPHSSWEAGGRQIARTGNARPNDAVPSTSTSSRRYSRRRDVNRHVARVTLGDTEEDDDITAFSEPELRAFSPPGRRHVTPPPSAALLTVHVTPVNVHPSSAAAVTRFDADLMQPRRDDHFRLRHTGNSNGDSLLVLPGGHYGATAVPEYVGGGLGLVEGGGGEVTAIDPLLRGVSRKGNQYHIAMKLNAVQSRPTSRAAVHGSRPTSRGGYAQPIGSPVTIADVTNSFHSTNLHIVDGYLVNAPTAAMHSLDRNALVPSSSSSDGRLLYHNSNRTNLFSHPPGIKRTDADGRSPPGATGSGGGLLVRIPTHSGGAGGGKISDMLSSPSGTESNYVIKSVTPTPMFVGPSHSLTLRPSAPVPPEERVEFDIELHTVPGLSGGRVGERAGGRSNGADVVDGGYETERRHVSGSEPVFTPGGNGEDGAPYKMKINDTMTVKYLPESNLRPRTAATTGTTFNDSGPLATTDDSLYRSGRPRRDEQPSRTQSPDPHFDQSASRTRESARRRRGRSAPRGSTAEPSMTSRRPARALSSRRDGRPQEYDDGYYDGGGRGEARVVPERARNERGTRDAQRPDRDVDEVDFFADYSSANRQGPSSRDRASEATARRAGADRALADRAAAERRLLQRSRGVDGLPNVVRGSILIRNAIETAGGPRHVDVVAGSDTDGAGFVVEDNTNLFHGKYFQSRENPMYNSDPERSDEEEDVRERRDGRRVEGRGRSAGGQGRRQPQLSELFEQDNQGGRRRIRAADSREGRRGNGEPLLPEPVLNRVLESSRINGEDAGLDEFTTEVPVVRGYGAPSKAVSGNHREPFLKQPSRTHDVADGQSRGRYPSDRPIAASHASSSSSIRQTVDVKREEDQIIGPDGKEGKAPVDPGMLNVDVVSEKVDLGLRGDGFAELTVCVRCERIVPIRGATDLYKKSSVIVTRSIEFDMTVTEARRALYDQAVRASRSREEGEGRGGDEGGAVGGWRGNRMTTKDTFELYQTLMAMADEDDAGRVYERRLRIDHELDEEKKRGLRAAHEALVEDMFDRGATRTLVLPPPSGFGSPLGPLREERGGEGLKNVRTNGGRVVEEDGRNGRRAASPANSEATSILF